MKILQGEPSLGGPYLKGGTEFRGTIFENPPEGTEFRGTIFENPPGGTEFRGTIFAVTALTNFKHGVHGLNEPHVVGSEPLSKLRHLGDQIGADVVVPRLAEVANQFLCNHHHVERIGHLVQEI